MSLRGAPAFELLTMKVETEVEYDELIFMPTPQMLPLVLMEVGFRRLICGRVECNRRASLSQLRCCR